MKLSSRVFLAFLAAVRDQSQSIRSIKTRLEGSSELEPRIFVNEKGEDALMRRREKCANFFSSTNCQRNAKAVTLSLLFSRPAASCLGDGSMESTCSRGLDGSLSGLRIGQWHLISQEGDHGVMGPMGQSL